MNFGNQDLEHAHAHVYFGNTQKIERVVEFAVGLCYNVQIDGHFFQICYKSFMMKKVFEEIVHVHKYLLSLKFLFK